MATPRTLGSDGPCPCGSGIIFADCCLQKRRAYIEKRSGFAVIRKLAAPPEHLEFLEREFARRRMFGEVRPVIHADWRGKKVVAVDNQVFAGNWRFFPDFLQDYIKCVLNPEWGKAEFAKPLNDRHPILQWYDGMCRFQRSLSRDQNGTICFLPDGCTMAYMLLAYDLFTLRQHRSLQSVVVNRLKNKEQFQGARHELFAAATCIRAGYSLEFEDEQDRTRKHVEFRATHRDSNVIISVEAKSRHRKGVLGQPGDAMELNRNRTRIGGLLNAAIKKGSGIALVIFIDVNVPAEDGNPFEKRWFKDVLRSLDTLDARSGPQNDQFNLIIFTNHPFHYAAPGEVAPSPDSYAIFGRNPAVPCADKSSLDAIHDAAVKFGNVPQRFQEAN